MSITSAQLSLEYYGPALEEHRMDAIDLGSALIAVGTLCRRAKEVANGSGRVTVDVTSTRHGSFEILLELVLSHSDLAIGYAITASTMLQSLGLIGSDEQTLGLLELLKWKAGRTVGSVREAEDALRVVSVGNNNINANNLTINYFRDFQSRRAAKGVVHPVGQDGVHGLRLGTNGHKTLDIDESELEYFQVVPEELTDVDILPPNCLVERWVWIRKAILIGSEKWGLMLDGKRIDATFSDKEFLLGSRVGAGDSLLVELAIRDQIKDDESIGTEYEVVKVLRRGPQEPRQTGLPADE